MDSKLLKLWTMPLDGIQFLSLSGGTVNGIWTQFTIKVKLNKNELGHKFSQ